MVVIWIDASSDEGEENYAAAIAAMRDARPGSR
jgi:hypothetical protein